MIQNTDDPEMPPAVPKSLEFSVLGPKPKNPTPAPEFNPEWKNQL